MQHTRTYTGTLKIVLALVRPDGYLGYRCQPASWVGLHGRLDRYLLPRDGSPGC